MAEFAHKDATCRQSGADAGARQHGQTRHEDRLTKLNYLGRIVTTSDTAWKLPKPASQSFDDVRAKQYVVGNSGGGSTTGSFVRD